ncbi:MAG: CRISPR-associated endoribonuclease Cas2 [Candidatus Dojkabacteria bacterium]|nr:MAG: CRISPR-associated endoribonuclease Cas2 [Candidatus Dojkabacteria bacterium]
MNNQKYMRILVFFDLPVNNPGLRKKYTKFRKFLLNDGYFMLQYSVYSRICKGLDGTKKHIDRLQKNVPQKGAIRALIITERQYEKMYILLGKPAQKETKNSADQLTLF